MNDKLPDKIRVEDEPLFDGVNCNDTAMRTMGRVRLSIDMVKEIDCDYPFDVLPNEGLYSSGRDIFRLEEYGVLFHELDLPHKTEIYPWTTQWMSVPVEFVNRENLYGNTALYSPKKDLYIGMIEYCVENREVEVWDGGGEVLYNCSEDEIGLFEVPDEVLFELLPNEYNSDLASQSI